jgi:hypothetical protein
MVRYSMFNNRPSQCRAVGVRASRRVDQGYSLSEKESIITRKALETLYETPVRDMFSTLDSHIHQVRYRLILSDAICDAREDCKDDMNSLKCKLAWERVCEIEDSADRHKDFYQ